MHNRIALCVLLATLTIAAHAVPITVSVRSGTLEGTEEGGVVAFKGVPFAAPPVGNLRWRAPAPVPHWPGVLRADRFGNYCMQNGEPSMGYEPGSVSEDCLYLNVWTKHGQKDLPVMVWLHGGGFNVGSAAMVSYDGASLARRGIVLVSINYRMGKFGFFAHPALTAEGHGHPVGNYGLMDMIAALQWVRENITSFGGNPRNVTLFGESAGGMAVNLLMESPGARGLFQRAIVESGGGRNPYPTLKQAEADGKSAAASWGVIASDGAALRSVPAKTVLGNATMAQGGGAPMIDGIIVPEQPLKAFKAGRIAHVPYMIGTNTFETGLFKGMAMALASAARPRWQEVERTFDGYGTHKPDLVTEQWGTDTFMTEPARALARAAAQHGIPSYLYVFSYLRPLQRGTIPGPMHFDEIYPLFDTMGSSLPPVSPDQMAVEMLQTRWTAFARSGRPGADWPQFLPGREAVMEFTNDGPVVRRDYAKARLDLVESIAIGEPAESEGRK